MKEFFRVLEKEYCEIEAILDDSKEMVLTEEDEKKIEETSHCEYCSVLLKKKCRHHCHVTGKFLAVTCSRCNLSQKPKVRRGIYTENRKSKTGSKPTTTNKSRFVEDVCEDEEDEEQSIVRRL